MPAECSSCKKTFTNKQEFCDACNNYCHRWGDTSLPKPSALPTIPRRPANNPLFLSGLAKGVHKKRRKSDSTQATSKNGTVTKTQRQQITLNKGIATIRNNKSTVIGEYGNGGALVQIHMTPSSRFDSGPSFWGVKRDGSVHPRVPTDSEIPTQYRYEGDDYDSSDDESAP